MGRVSVDSKLVIHVSSRNKPEIASPRSSFLSHIHTHIVIKKWVILPEDLVEQRVRADRRNKKRQFEGALAIIMVSLLFMGGFEETQVESKESQFDI